jgi:acyl-CoA thioesterase
MTARHPFDDAIALFAQEDGLHAGSTSPQYANMVGPFGGITAATLLHAAWKHPARLGEPVSLTVNYAAPIEDGEFAIRARPVRSNRSTQHWMIELSQGGEAAATATAVFATRRETWSATEARFPAVPPAAAIEKLSGPVPAKWIQNYDMRFVRGTIFLHDQGEMRNDSESVLWIRDEPRRQMDFFSLTAICDAFFPRIFVRRQRRTPIGTVSLTIFFHADSQALAHQGDSEVLGIARALQFRNGFFDQHAEIWSPNGALLATSTQMVYFKE